MRQVLTNESDTIRRRIYFRLKSTSNPAFPAESEAGGQPRISIDGAASITTGVGALQYMGDGLYYSDLTQAAVNIPAGSVIWPMYSSGSAMVADVEGLLVTAYNPISNDIISIGGLVSVVTKLTLSARGINEGTVDSSTFTPTTSQFESANIADAASDLHKLEMGIFTSGVMAFLFKFRVSSYSKVGAKGRFTVTLLDTVSPLPSAPIGGTTFVLI